MELFRRFCVECGKEFQTERRYVLCCSIECHMIRRNKQKQASATKIRAQKKEIADQLKTQADRIAELVKQNADQMNRIKNLENDKGETEKLKQVIQRLENDIKSRDARIEKLKNQVEGDGNITFDHCDRLRLDAFKLPCGLRNECWPIPIYGWDKCERNQLEKKPEGLSGINPSGKQGRPRKVEEFEDDD